MLFLLLLLLWHMCFFCAECSLIFWLKSCLTSAMYLGMDLLRHPERRDWRYQDTSQMSDSELIQYYKCMPNEELQKDLLPRLGPLAMWFTLMGALIKKQIRDHVWQTCINILRIKFRRENVVECICSFVKNKHKYLSGSKHKF